MEIKKMFLTKNEYSRPGTPLAGVLGVVLHWVGNPGSSAEANRNYFEGLKNQAGGTETPIYASAHYIIGLQGEIIQCLPENEVAYHVGAKIYNPLAIKRLSSYPNNTTIGVELCHKDWIGVFNPETMDSAHALIGDLLKRYGLSRYGLFRHYDITYKDCPRYFVQDEGAWKNFIESFA
jgi:N-acetylmuramoyl-L-alanine amidase